MHRRSKRKQRILNRLQANNGVMLLNELLYQELAEHVRAGVTSSTWNFIRSFKRTVFRFGAPIQTFKIVDYDGKGRTAGMVARLAVWELLHRGRLSSLPEATECSIVVGCDALALVGELKKGTRGVLYSGNVRDVILVTDGEVRLTADTLRKVSAVPWKLYGVRRDHTVAPLKSASVPIDTLLPLPDTASWPDKNGECQIRLK